MLYTQHNSTKCNTQPTRERQTQCTRPHTGASLPVHDRGTAQGSRRGDEPDSRLNRTSAYAPEPKAAHVLQGSPSDRDGSHLLLDFLHLSHAVPVPVAGAGACVCQQGAEHACINHHEVERPRAHLSRFARSSLGLFPVRQRSPLRKSPRRICRHGRESLSLSRAGPERPCPRA